MANFGNNNPEIGHFVVCATGILKNIDRKNYKAVITQRQRKRQNLRHISCSALTS